MFGAIKKLFSRRAGPPHDAISARVEPAAAPAPAPPAAPALAPSPPPARIGDEIALPLNDILARLPDGLTQLILTRPGGSVSFSINLVWEQLRTGAVRVSFGQLREASPPGTFADNASHDDSLLDLPLPLILAAIGPGGLARRPDQKRVEVPDEVKGVFGAGYNPLVRVSSPSAAPVAPAPAPNRAPAVQKPVAPRMPALATAKPTTSIAPGPAASKPVSPLPFATARPAPPPAAPAAAPDPTGDKVVTTIEAVSGAWPEAVRQEIEQLNLAGATISIPLKRLEPAMKTGRVVFTWADLCGWFSVPMPPTPNGGSQVELPLNVIAPLFLAKHRFTAPRKSVMIGDNVPDLFAVLGRPAAPPPAPEPEAALPATATARAPATAAGPNVLGEMPSETDWTPKELMQQILGLPGVAGGVLASADGLLVAGRTPVPVSAEILAAFLPQIFARVGGCVEEAQLGALRAMTLTTGSTPCAMFKARALYLAVLCRPGQMLPEAALQRIAGELAALKH